MRPRCIRLPRLVDPRIVRAMTTRALSCLALSLTLLACESTPTSPSSPPTRGRPVVIDGLFNEWDRGPGRASVVLADADYLYVRLGVEGEDLSLQSGRETFSIWIDADDDPRTGRRVGRPAPAATLGTDLEIRFSPAQGGRITPGASVVVYAADGTPSNVSPYAIGLVAAPTHSSSWFEVRISRHLDGVPGLPDRGLLSSGSLAGLHVLSNERSEPVGWSEAPFSVNLPPRAPAPPLADIRLPATHPDAIRIVSFNVLRSAPAVKRREFAHLFQILDPDIVLLQEWDAPPEEIQSWFAVLMGDPRATWHVRKGDAWGVAIASRHPIEPLGPDRLALPGEDASAPPVRFIAGIVRTPLGEVGVASVHLKCCGSAGSDEDRRRLAEAQAVRDALAEAFSESATSMRVVGGDLNLVGSRDPLLRLARTLDADGTDLTPVSAPLLGDATHITWSDPASPFPPGRLDWLLVGDARASIVNSFVLDTARLTDAALARMGLDRGDSSASDHRPVVVDLRPAR